MKLDMITFHQGDIDFGIEYIHVKIAVEYSHKRNIYASKLSNLFHRRSPLFSIIMAISKGWETPREIHPSLLKLRGCLSVYLKSKYVLGKCQIYHE